MDREDVFSCARIFHTIGRLSSVALSSPSPIPAPAFLPTRSAISSSPSSPPKETAETASDSGSRRRLRLVNADLSVFEALREKTLPGQFFVSFFPPNPWMVFDKHIILPAQSYAIT